MDTKIQHYQEMFEICLINDDPYPKFVVCLALLGKDSEYIHKYIILLNIDIIYNIIHITITRYR